MDENWKGKKFHPIATLFTTDAKWLRLRSNWGLCGGKLELTVWSRAQSFLFGDKGWKERATVNLTTLVVLSCAGAIIDGVSNDDRIYCTLSYCAWLHSTNHYRMQTSVLSQGLHCGRSCAPGFTYLQTGLHLKLINITKLSMREKTFRWSPICSNLRLKY
jgi:hypothetical protein